MQPGHLFSLTPLVAAVLLSCTSDDAPQTEVAAKTRTDNRPNVIVVFTDDQGYADIGANGVVTDIVTPHIDQLASDGVRMTAGYVTAPQCTPSRASLLTGRYQQKFNLDDNSLTPMTLAQPTMADRLQEVGYRTGMAGKWHLGIDQNSPDFDVNSTSLEVRAQYFPDQRGFDDVYYGFRNTWWTNFDFNGNEIRAAYRHNEDYRLDVTTEAALAFIEKHRHQPFFLYLPYFAPHVPMEATEEYLSRHESTVETRRKYALAMMSAIDDGVGRIRQKLDELELAGDTVLFFISDNGAPLGIHMDDAPIEDNTAAWDGSLNTPWIGEKGMLTEGGIRVPYIVTWPDNLPPNTVFDNAVSTLDVAATTLELAGADTSELDGVDLIPHLTGNTHDLDERPLYWRFWNQAAIRVGDWKYLTNGANEYLFDLAAEHENKNLITSQPAIAQTLREQLSNWSDTLSTPGMPQRGPNNAEAGWYNHYLGSITEL